MIKLEHLLMEHSILFSVEENLENMLIILKFLNNYRDYSLILMKDLRNKFNI